MTKQNERQNQAKCENELFLFYEDKYLQFLKIISCLQALLDYMYCLCIENERKNNENRSQIAAREQKMALKNRKSV